MLHLFPYLPQYDSGPSLHLAIFNNKNNMVDFQCFKSIVILKESYHENSIYLPAIAAAVAGASVVVGSKT